MQKGITYMNPIIDTYVCIDLETTGLNPKEDRIIEIGAVKVENGIQTGVFETFVNPGRTLEPRITELTGIRDEDLADAPCMAEVLPKFLEFAGEHVLLGHSVLFDYSFLKKAAVNEKKTFERQGIDTLKIARIHLATLEHRNLGFLCEYYGIPHKAHRALEDAKATVLLYEKLTRQFCTEENEREFLPQKLNFNVKRDTPATKAQIERLYKLIDKHKLNSEEISPEKLKGLPAGFPGDLPKDMTRSQASRYADLILAAFGR